MKTCSRCKITKSLKDFSKDKRGRLGVCIWCKSCTAEYKKTIQKSQNRKRQQKLHTDKTYRDYVRSRDRAWRRDNPKLHLYQQCKNRAKRQGIEFNLTPDDIVIPVKCPILNVLFIPGVKKDYRYTYSLDRINNNKGYVKGNVAVISALANHMKNQASNEELLAFASNIKNYITNNDIVPSAVKTAGKV